MRRAPWLAIAWIVVCAVACDGPGPGPRTEPAGVGPSTQGDEAATTPAPFPPLRTRLHLAADGERRFVAAVEHLDASGAATYRVTLPIVVDADSSEPYLDLGDRGGFLDAGFVAATNGEVLALVASGGVLTMRLSDGAVRFVEESTGDELLGFDDARGTITVGTRRCEFDRGHRGRIAEVCGDRLVLVRGGTRVHALDRAGGLLDAKTVVPTGRSLMPHVEVRVADVALVYDGRIYVH